MIDDAHNIDTRIKCPYCKKFIAPDSKICRYCQLEIQRKDERPLFIIFFENTLDMKCESCPNDGKKCRACKIAHLRRVMKDSTLHDYSE